MTPAAAGVEDLLHRDFNPSEILLQIRCRSAHPTPAHTVLAGGDTGSLVSHYGGARWERIKQLVPALRRHWILLRAIAVPAQAVSEGW